MVEYNFEKDRFLYRLIVIILREPEKQCRDKVIEYFIIELLLCSSSKTTIDGHVYYKNITKTDSLKQHITINSIWKCYDTIIYYIYYTFFTRLIVRLWKNIHHHHILMDLHINFNNFRILYFKIIIILINLLILNKFNLKDLFKGWRMFLMMLLPKDTHLNKKIKSQGIKFFHRDILLFYLIVKLVIIVISLMIR